MDGYDWIGWRSGLDVICFFIVSCVVWRRLARRVANKKTLVMALMDGVWFALNNGRAASR